MTGVRAVSHNGEAISGGESGDHNGAVMTLTDMTGSVSVMAETATVRNRFTVPTDI